MGRVEDSWLSNVIFREQITPATSHVRRQSKLLRLKEEKRERLSPRPRPRAQLGTMITKDLLSYMKERMNPSARAAGSSSNGTARGMKSLFYRRGPARLGSARRTETSLLATRRWKLESRARTDRPQEQPPLEWHERRVHRVHPSALALFLRLSPFLPLSRFFLSFRLFPLTPAAFINPEPTVHASGSDDTANICPPFTGEVDAERSLPFVNVGSHDENYYESVRSGSKKQKLSIVKTSRLYKKI